ncbi:hypothetical protein DL93DRAFT_2062501 [Clavulina sp. PMI_390]|nr:hypothetical protein DL93DRAFT_2062501 [Clavulina sp. PMI_390]
MSQQQQRPLRSDVSRRGPLDTGLIRRNINPSTQEQTSEQYLAQITEDWHKRVDHDVKSLATGMTALVQTALVPKDKYHARHDAFQAQALAENMVLAADSLLTITHSLKLMYLLTDEEEITTRKAKDLRVIREETEAAKLAVASHWGALFDSDDTPLVDEETS